MDDYNRDNASITDAREKAQHQYLRELFASDPLFTYKSAPLTYDSASLKDVAYVNQLISAVNKITAAKICDPAPDRSIKMQPKDSRTFIMLLWVEHDNVYKADADDPANHTDKISHKTPTELKGARSNVGETVVVTVTAEQVD